MAELLADQILRKIDETATLYNRLVLVVAPAGSGKTCALQEVQARTGIPLINLNLELSRRMLDLTERQRALQIPRLLSEIVNSFQTKTILLDNTEILFDTLLKQDPLRLLRGLSRNITVVVSWNGTINSEHIMYAEPGHSEFKQYPIRDFLIAGTDITT
jgi:hypothetical protein